MEARYCTGLTMILIRVVCNHCVVTEITCTGNANILSSVSYSCYCVMGGCSRSGTEVKNRQRVLPLVESA